MIYVNEQFDGWKAECLNETHSFPLNDDVAIMEPIRMSPSESVKKVCIEALELKLPFGEIEVLEENLDLIRRQIGVEEVMHFPRPVLSLLLCNAILRPLETPPPSFSL